MIIFRPLLFGLRILPFPVDNLWWFWKVPRAFAIISNTKVVVRRRTYSSPGLIWQSFRTVLDENFHFHGIFYCQYWGQMLGARLSGLREAERVLNRMEDVEHLAKELRSIALESSSAHKTMQTKARFLNSLSPISPIVSTPVPPNQYTGSHCATPIPQLELTRQERSFVQQDRKSSLGSLNHQKPQTLLIPYSRSSTTFHYSQKIQQPRPILVKAKITDLPEWKKVASSKELQNIYNSRFYVFFS